MPQSAQGVRRHLTVLHAHGDVKLVTMGRDGGDVITQSKIGSAEIAMGATFAFDVASRLSRQQVLWERKGSSNPLYSS